MLLLLYKDEKHPGYEGHPIAEKGTEDFKQAKAKYFSLFNKQNKDSIHPDPGNLGLQIKPDKTKELPMPFACPSLVACPTTDPNSVVWLCDRGGCICVCAREDFKTDAEKYPNYCPPLDWDQRGGWEPEDEDRDDFEDDDDFEYLE